MEKDSKPIIDEIRASFRKHPTRYNRELLLYHKEKAENNIDLVYGGSF